MRRYRRRFSGCVVVMMGLCFVMPGCSRKQSARQQASAAAESSASLAASVVTGALVGTVHNPSHPPIDCPLRKQGIDASHLRPFEQVTQYIEFLERADRAQWQKPDAVVASLGLNPRDVVFDLGAGSGYFSFRFAAAVPDGRVIAADTEPEMVRHIHHRAMTEGIRNVQVKLIKPNAPEVEAGADVVFLCDVLHHVSDRAGWLNGITSSMKTGARLVLIEFKQGKLPEGPPESMKIARAELVSLVTSAGLDLEKEHGDLLPYQVFLEFRKP